MQSEVQSEMEAAVKFAVDAPYPGTEEVELHVYAGS
jgi:TPP-dependent pyruvate/acetoin dehydrogenase alpha subunit